MTSQNNRYFDVMRNLAVSTPNLSANQSSLFQSNRPDKKFAAKIISRVKSFAYKKKIPSKKLEEARKFYDEIDDETMTSSTSSVDSDFHSRESPVLARNSPVQSVDSTKTSPSIRFVIILWFFFKT